jgi:hypothetical protein
MDQINSSIKLLEIISATRLWSDNKVEIDVFVFYMEEIQLEKDVLWKNCINCSMFEHR